MKATGKKLGLVTLVVGAIAWSTWGDGMWSSDNGGREVGTARPAAVQASTSSTTSGAPDLPPRQWWTTKTAANATGETPPVPSTAKPSPPAPPASNSPPAPDSSTAGSSCEEGLERVDGLGTLGADCETGRRVAAAYDSEVMGAGTFPDNAPLAVADDWFCGSKVSDESQETFAVLCDKGNPGMEAVSFTWGV
jgi:hypothetical protein